jgi:hypothetical protein
MSETPKQVEHTPVVQDFLDKLAAMLDIGKPDKDQSMKNPDCTLQAGSIGCLNAASCLCQCCEWWDGIAEENEDE